eukprot:CAMPEP_0201511380 /NCGR_PEP_ID=MMETSP0161_2-20130828/3852_1 /ASSEMBLY_ACC=CAM_ASM_000251 /TAXON_ID=180227 /ORGANISM="Neoparamoeba aestuarina, Strain SoJaBio B1-5/56/2" /LENGTH=248 /DNA_ID=CAMNT_0047906855 /DNA_START=662 /DNA_END=1408 /DNA_ORIENTATION=+
MRGVGFYPAATLTRSYATDAEAPAAPAAPAAPSYGPIPSDADVKKLVSTHQSQVKASGDASGLAKALFAFAKSKNELATVSDELNQLKQHLKNDLIYWNSFGSNTVSDADLKSLGCSESLYHAMSIGKKKKELGSFASVIRQYQEMVEGEPQVVNALVSSVNPMDKAAQEKLLTELKTNFPELSNSEINLRHKVDLSLIDGYTFSAGALFVDASARQKLASVEQDIFKKIDQYYGLKNAEFEAYKGWP